MALSQDEQRVLAEIERRLAADDPGLATCLTSFRRPGPANVLRSPRARIIGSLFTVLLVAMVSLMVYAMIPFRAHNSRTPATPSTATTGLVTATGASIQAGGSPPPARPSATSTSGAISPAEAATPVAGISATGGTRAAAGQATSPTAGP
jgi:hypothetical protein